MLGLISLVYFSTSLKGNEILLEKLLSMDFVHDYPDVPSCWRTLSLRISRPSR